MLEEKPSKVKSALLSVPSGVKRLRQVHTIRRHFPSIVKIMMKHDNDVKPSNLLSRQSLRNAWTVISRAHPTQVERS